MEFSVFLIIFIIEFVGFFHIVSSGFWGWFVTDWFSLGWLLEFEDGVAVGVAEG